MIGVGSQGQDEMRNFLTYEGVRALCDGNQRNIASAREKIAQAYGTADVRALSDFHAVNADPGIDAVLMALPVPWHSIAALDAIVHGKHIYHEKPVAPAGRVTQDQCGSVFAAWATQNRRRCS